VRACGACILAGGLPGIFNDEVAIYMRKVASVPRWQLVAQDIAQYALLWAHEPPTASKSSPIGDVLSSLTTVSGWWFLYAHTERCGLDCVVYVMMITKT